MSLSNLTIYLLKDVTTIESLIRVTDGRMQGEIIYSPQSVGNDQNFADNNGNFWFITKFGEDKPAAWFDFLSSELDGLHAHRNKFYTHATYGLLVLSLKCQNESGHESSTFFAIPFGYGGHLLDMSKVVPSFGLRCVVNVVPSMDLRQVDLTMPEQHSLKKKFQSSINVGAHSFDINQKKDILKGVSGPLAERYEGDPNDLSDEDKKRQAPYANPVLAGVTESFPLGKGLDGSDGLRISCQINSLQQIKALCARFYAFFQSDHYKADFGWIDNLKAINSHESIMAILDHKLVREVYARNIEGMSLAAPDYINEAYNYDGYSYAGNYRCTSLTMYPSLEGFLDYYGDRINEFIEEDDDGRLKGISKLKNGCRLLLVNHDTDDVKSWPLYKTISWETEEAGERYVLCEGSWYKINTDFRDEIESFFDDLVRRSQVNPVMLKAKAIHEEAGPRKYEAGYNKYVVDSSNDKALLFDLGADRAKEIRSDGYEFCDIFIFGDTSTKGQMVHVKVGKSSAALSHLFRQGANSARMMKAIPRFRSDVLSKSGSAKFRALFRDDQIETHEFEVCFAVLLEERQKKDIPFFSKVSIKDALESNIIRDNYRAQFWFIEGENRVSD